MTDLKGDTTFDLVNTRIWPRAFHSGSRSTTPTGIFLYMKEKKGRWIQYYSFCKANFLMKWSAFVLSVACIMTEPIFVDGICLKGQRWNKITALTAGAQQRSSKWKIWLKWSWSVSFTLVGWHPKVIAGLHGEFYNSLRWWAHKLKLQKMDIRRQRWITFWQQCWYCNYSPE